MTELADFAGTPRFRPVRRLGSGGMGVVYEVEDLELGQRVALKALRRADGETIYRLKREFRTLAGIEHANLITLHELFVGTQCFFTMELVEGCDLMAFVRGLTADAGAPEPAVASGHEPTLPTSIACNEARLRQVLPQLLRGLGALHDAAQVHRDVKPTNVLVTRNGRAVLLDFGLVAPIDLPDSDESPTGHVVGTVSYMAPEQCRGDRPSPAADLYAVGVMLYEALTGRVPFEGPTLRVLVEKQEYDPAPPRALVPSVPKDLDALCVDLLARDPRTRPTGDVVLRRLGADVPAQRGPRTTVTLSRSQNVPFHGRQAELARLHARLEAIDLPEAGAILVRGASGMGKSALVRRFLGSARERHPGLVVLEGKCYEREQVTYPALDSLVDHLSRYWSALPRDEAAVLVPREPGLLPRLFPVLERVGPIASATRTRAVTDPQELRTRAYGALREVLQRLGDRRPLLLFLDDLQWADASTLLLLADLMRPPDPPILLLILACRPEGSGPVEEVFRGMALGRDEIDLGPLSESDAARLAADCLGSVEASPLAQRIAREAGGDPFFVGELAQYALTVDEAAVENLHLDELIGHRIAPLRASSRQLLDVLVLAGEPVTQAVAGSAADLTQPELAREIGVLRTLKLLRTVGTRGEESLESSHDRIRAAVLSRMPAEVQRRLHRELALAYRQAGEATHDRMARHWRGAGDDERAAEHARSAAVEAMTRLDFDRAATFYLLALELGHFDGPSERALREALADALVHAGRPVEAAQAFVLAAQTTEAVQTSDLHRRAAEQLLRGGYIAEGMAALDRVLADIGLRLQRSPLRALISLLWRRTLLRLRSLRHRPRAAGSVSPQALIEIDICWSASTGLSIVDTIRGADFQARGLLLALRLGEPGRIARALGAETGFNVSTGRVARARILAAEALRIGSQLADAYVLGSATAAGAFVAYFGDNAWRRALELFLSAGEHFRRELQAGWEIDTIQLFVCLCRLYLGDIGELVRTVPGFVREAERRGDRYMAVTLRTRIPLAWLVRDDPDGADRDVASAIRSWMPAARTLQVQHFFALHSRCEIALYRGDPASARALLEERRKALGRSLLLRVLMIHAETLHLDGRIALAEAALEDPGAPARRQALRRARRVAKQLGRFRLPVARAWSLLLRASVAQLEGAGAEASVLLRNALADLDAGETALYATAARWRLAEIVGGPEGETLAARARAWMAAQGVRNADRLVAMLLPGWPRPDDATRVRRTHTTEQIASRCRGSGVMAGLAFVRQRFGATALDALLEQLPPEQRFPLREAGPTDWVPTSAYTALLHLLVRTHGRGDPQICFESGYFQAAHELSLVLRMIYRLANPRLVLGWGASLWAQNFDTGTLRTESPRPGQIRATIAAWSDADPALCSELRGYFTRTLELAGGRDVKCAEVQCAARGDPACVFEATYGP